MPIRTGVSYPGVGGIISPTNNDNSYVPNNDASDHEYDPFANDDFVQQLGKAGGVGESEDGPKRSLQDTIGIPSANSFNPAKPFLREVARLVGKPDAKTLTRAELLTGALRLQRTQPAAYSLPHLRRLQELERLFTPAPQRPEPKSEPGSPPPEKKVSTKPEDWMANLRDTTAQAQAQGQGKAPQGTAAASDPNAPTPTQPAPKKKRKAQPPISPASSLNTPPPVYRTPENNPPVITSQFLKGNVPLARSGENPGPKPLPGDEADLPYAQDPADDLYVDLDELQKHDSAAAEYGWWLHQSGTDALFSSPNTISLTELQIRDASFTQQNPQLFKRLAAGLQSKDGAVKPWWNDDGFKPDFDPKVNIPLPTPAFDYALANGPQPGRVEKGFRRLLTALIGPDPYAPKQP